MGVFPIVTRLAMDIIISGKDFRLTPSLKTYVTQKVGKLAHYWGKISRARVELDVDHNQKSGNIYRVEVWLDIPGEPDIALGAKAADMHAAIDVVVPKLERQIMKLKGREQAKLRRERRSKRASA